MHEWPGHHNSIKTNYCGPLIKVYLLYINLTVTKTKTEQNTVEN